MHVRVPEVVEPVAAAGGAGVIVLEVDRLPASNSSRNVHWRVKHRERKEWQVSMMIALGRNRFREPIERASVIFIRRSAREGDYCNLVSSFKLIEDLLQPASKRNPGGLGLIVGDDPQHLEAEYRWEKAPRGKGSVRIEVSEAKVDPEGDEVGSQYG